MPVVEPLDGGDLDAVLGLIVQLWPGEPFDASNAQDALRALTDDPSCIMLVAHEGDRAVGFARGLIWYDLQSQALVVSLTELIVDSSFRRQGVGTQLLDAMIGSAQERSCVEIRLTSSFKREEAHAFYGSKGFTRSAYLFWKDI